MAVIWSTFVGKINHDSCFDFATVIMIRNFPIFKIYKLSNAHI